MPFLTGPKPAKSFAKRLKKQFLTPAIPYMKTKETAAADLQRPKHIERLIHNIPSSQKHVILIFSLPELCWAI